MKGGLVCGIIALEALLNIHPQSSNIAVLFNSDVEPGSPHSRVVLQDLAANSKRALILEPADSKGEVVAGRKGVGIFRIVVKGTASHAGSEPEEGASAIHEIAHKTLCCLGLPNPSLGTTVNVGSCQGGTYPYVVAEKAEIQLDFRVPTHSEAERVEEGMRAICRMTFVPGTRTELHGGFHRPPMEQTEGNQSLLEELEHLAERIGLHPP